MLILLCERICLCTKFRFARRTQTHQHSYSLYLLNHVPLLGADNVFNGSCSSTQFAWLRVLTHACIYPICTHSSLMHACIYPFACIRVLTHECIYPIWWFYRNTSFWWTIRIHTWNQPSRNNCDPSKSILIQILTPINSTAPENSPLEKTRILVMAKFTRSRVFVSVLVRISVNRRVLRLLLVQLPKLGYRV